MTCKVWFTVGICEAVEKNIYGCELDNFLDIKTQCADNYNQSDCIDVN